MASLDGWTVWYVCTECNVLWGGLPPEDYSRECPTCPNCDHIAHVDFWGALRTPLRDPTIWTPDVPVGYSLRTPLRADPTIFAPDLPVGYVGGRRPWWYRWFCLCGRRRLHD